MGLYAAYGSNMDPAQMLRRCPSSPHTGTGWIRGWRLTFGGEELGWEGALATLVPAEDDGVGGDTDAVFVALYDLTEADERALDSWEGADSGLYRRVHLRVHTLGGDVVAYAYVLDAFEGGLPSARHLGAIADGAEAAGAPDDYVHELRARPCRSAF
ncbi:gamma-glutamylcyclotransferase [Blastococcus saxobsidens]|uniref:AIG2 family protein n=1 Tax=Blastococcus saxobsidens TaxID=138336 RepID=A0A4Q7Y7Z7_9ACTN|nr:gamma-glutamylcyclotransferase [Blastococcus saxobsidens]RZU33070.1 AIG2 family protein [Blastococcus saxobsidens]